ncbi:MAG: DinB family protein [Tetrasphaera sp.]
MAELANKHLDGSTFTRVSLKEARFEDVYLTDAHFHDIDFSRARIRAARLDDVTMRGVIATRLELYGEFEELLVNGVNVLPLVEAELDARMPERTKMRPSDPEGFREAFAIVERLWGEAVERARGLAPEHLHESVDGEWSFVETLRHLNFAYAVWIDGTIRGIADPWHPLDLPWDQAPTIEGVPRDREVRPSMDEVVAQRDRHRATVGEVLDGLTPERLAETVESAVPFNADWGPYDVAKCLTIVLNEEWEHRLYAERDLAAIDNATLAEPT